MAEPEVEAFLTHLAVSEHVSASTQNQALCALIFLYRYVLKQPLAETIDAARVKRSQHLPTVLTPDEVSRLLQQMSGIQQLFAKRLYGSGMRLTEGLRLRVKDLDFGHSQITVRGTKCKRDHTITFPLTNLLGAGKVMEKFTCSMPWNGNAPKPTEILKFVPSQTSDWFSKACFEEWLATNPDDPLIIEAITR